MRKVKVSGPTSIHLLSSLSDVDAGSVNIWQEDAALEEQTSRKKQHPTDRPGRKLLAPRTILKRENVLQ